MTLLDCPKNQDNLKEGNTEAYELLNRPQNKERNNNKKEIQWN